MQTEETEKAKIPRAIAFPKFYILELVDISTDHECFVRIHEKARNDNESAQAVVIRAEGFFSGNGKPTEDLNPPFELQEEFTALKVLSSEEADTKLLKFANIFVQAHQNRFPKITTAKGDLTECKLEVEYEIPECDEEPWKVQKYPNPHKIQNFWKDKNDRDELIVDVNTDAIIFNVEDPTQDLQYEKVQKKDNQDPVSLYRVSLEEKGGLPSRATSRMPAISDIKSSHNISFERLSLNGVDLEHLSEHQNYLLCTPLVVCLWVGKEVKKAIFKGCLNILKAFCSD